MTEVRRVSRPTSLDRFFLASSQPLFFILVVIATIIAALCRWHGTLAYSPTKIAFRQQLAYTSKGRRTRMNPQPKQEQLQLSQPVLKKARRSEKSTTELFLAESSSSPPPAANAKEAEADAATTNEPPVEAGTHQELMYALGVNLARQLGDVRPLVQDGQELAQVAKGLLDTIIGRFSEEGQVSLLGRRGKELNQLIADRANTIREKLEEAGKSMLQTMSETEGVEMLPSGVAVHVLEHGPEGPGQGVRPTKASTVKIHYHGTLADGTVFDSTLGGDPVSFPLNGVIPGWREGVMKLHEGETAMLGIPPEQGYGEKGTPDGRIPGGSTLFFKIQLLEVMSAGVGGSPSLLGADGTAVKSKNKEGSGLLGADGKPL